MIRLAAPSMRQRGGGAIVNISSISGWEAQLVGTAQYGSSKAAQIFLTERLALELVHDNIRVNTVSPGSIIWEDGSWDRFRLAQPRILCQLCQRWLPDGAAWASPKRWPM